MDLQNFDEQSIQLSIHNEWTYDSNEKCKVCAEYLKIELHPRDVVFLDVEKVTYNEETKKYVNKKTEISKISSGIRFGNFLFELKGVIEHVGMKGGHFVAHMKRPDGKYETYDDLNTFKATKPPKNVSVVALIYTKLCNIVGKY